MGDNARQLDSRVMLNQIIQGGSINAQIIDANQQQLQSGIEADGSSMGNYSPVSVAKYGKPDGPITLKDTGATYDTMVVVIAGDSIKIHADMDLHGVDLTERFPNALGLTSDSLDELKPEIATDVIDKTRTQLLQR